MAQGEREDLVRPQGRIVARFPIDDVVEVLPVGEPEAAVEGLARAIREAVQIGPVALERAIPVRKQPNRVVPERVDLDRLAATRGDDPVTDLGIHPGERQIRGALRQQAIIVHANAESRAGQMQPDDFIERRQKIAQRVTVVRDGHVAVDRVKEPERRIGGVVETFLTAFREQVRNQAVTKVAGEGQEDAARFRRSGRYTA